MPRTATAEVCNSARPTTLVFRSTEMPKIRAGKQTSDLPTRLADPASARSNFTAWIVSLVHYLVKPYQEFFLWRRGGLGVEFAGAARAAGPAGMVH
jgi:hypothetical protein